MTARKALAETCVKRASLFCRGAGLLFGDEFPIDLGGVGPEVFEVVEVSAFGREDVQDDVAVVLQNPGPGLAAFNADARAVTARFHQLLDFFGDGSHLASAGGGRDDKKIHDRRG